MMSNWMLNENQARLKIDQMHFFFHRAGALNNRRGCSFYSFKISIYLFRFISQDHFKYSLQMKFHNWDVEFIYVYLLSSLHKK